MHVDDAIRGRRSHKLFDGTPIAHQTLTELVELATWAPNHRRTEPWRFAVCEQARLPELADVACARLQAGQPASDKIASKIQKLRTMLGGAGAVIAVSYVRSPDDPARDREDYAAAACAIENLMLAAWGRGVGSYWTTSDALIHPDLGAFWRTGEGEELIAAIVLGGPLVEMPAVRQKTVGDVTRWL